MGLRNRAEPRCGRMDRPFGLMEPRPITYLVNHVWVLHALLLVLISHSWPGLVLKRSIFDEEDSFDYPAHGPLLVTRRSLSVQPKTNEKEQRENLFHSRCLISEKVCSLIIDGWSCTNIATDILVRKLGLATRPLSRPFRLEWLNETGEQYVKEQVTIILFILMFGLHLAYLKKIISIM